ncbi:hypothetical protein [Bacillus cereus]|uniref:hypothetical protein n=1 Tax=Bacillus cereus TaxID=1396 RepID=UPI000B7CD859|nr:hypothetical protein [Bacillus cereus]
MIWEKKLERIFHDIENSSYFEGCTYRPLLDISEPIMFLLNELNDYYLAYVLQNRTAILNNGLKADIVEVLIVSTSISDIKLMLVGEMDLHHILTNGNKVRIGKVGHKLFPPKMVEELTYIKDKIPREGITMGGALPNKVNIKKELMWIEAEMKRYERYAFDRPKTHIENERKYKGKTKTKKLIQPQNFFCEIDTFSMKINRIGIGD